jgi:phage baseplate assembly protein W
MTTPTYFGYNFPFIQNNIVLQQQSDERLIKNYLIQLLLTEPGERVQRPGFGTRLRSFVFELEDSESIVSLRSSMLSAIEIYEPRVQVKDLIIEAGDNNVLNIKLYASLSIRPNERFSIEIGLNTQTGEASVVRPNE